VRRTISNLLIDLGARRAFDVIDLVAYWRRLGLTARSNRAFRAANAGFATPPLSILWDAQATTDLAEYKRSGEEAAALYWGLIRPHLDFTQPARVCEWGCGPGRIIRHLPALAAGFPVDFYGSDYNRASIAWCRANLPGITCFANDLAPPLAVTDAFFDAIFCRSVFTHLSAEMHHRWIGELRRVVRPGGIVILTTHGDAYRPRLTAQERIRYDAGELVMRTLGAEGRKLFAAFHPPGFVRARLLTDLSILEHRPGEGTQDIWVARRPTDLAT
jgi:SAM-dependent methyltransferase